MTVAEEDVTSMLTPPESESPARLQAAASEADAELEEMDTAIVPLRTFQTGKGTSYELKLKLIGPRIVSSELRVNAFLMHVPIDAADESGATRVQSKGRRSVWLLSDNPRSSRLVAEVQPEVAYVTLMSVTPNIAVLASKIASTVDSSSELPCETT